VFIIFVCTFLVLAANAEAGGTQQTRASVSLSWPQTVLVRLTSPSGAALNSVDIFNADGLSVFHAASIKLSRVILLPAGIYTISAKKSAKNTINLDSDGSLTLSGGKWTFTPAKGPQQIVFKSGNTVYRSSITETYAYRLSVFDIDNPGILSPADYTAHVTGGGVNKDVPLTNDGIRYISESPLVFSPGTVTVTVSVRGASMPPQSFTVKRKEPFTWTITNTWHGDALNGASFRVFKYTSGMGAIPEKPETLTREKFDTFAYNNAANEVKTGGAAVFTFPQKVHDRDQFVLVLLGSLPKDNVYSRLVSANENTPKQSVSWDVVPAKSGKEIIASIDYDSLEDWEAIDDFEVYFYYRAGVQANIPKKDVLAAKWNKTSANFRRDSREARISVFPDLDNICTVSNYNYLIVVEDVNGMRFSMNNTAFEMSAGAVLYRER